MDHEMDTGIIQYLPSKEITGKFSGGLNTILGSTLGSCSSWTLPYNLRGNLAGMPLAAPIPWVPLTGI